MLQTLGQGVFLAPRLWVLGHLPVAGVWEKVEYQL